MPVGSAKFDLNRCNVSPLRGEKPDFWPVSNNNTGSLPLRGILPVNIFAPTARARSAIFPKLCMVMELVVPIKKVAIHFFDLIHSFSARGQNVDFWLLSKNNTGSLPLRGSPASNKSNDRPGGGVQGANFF